MECTSCYVAAVLSILGGKLQRLNNMRNAAHVQCAVLLPAFLRKPPHGIRMRPRHSFSLYRRRSSAGAGARGLSKMGRALTGHGFVG